MLMHAHYAHSHHFVGGGGSASFFSLLFSNCTISSLFIPSYSSYGSSTSFSTSSPSRSSMTSAALGQHLGALCRHWRISFTKEHHNVPAFQLGVCSDIKHLHFLCYCALQIPVHVGCHTNGRTDSGHLVVDYKLQTSLLRLCCVLLLL